MYYQERIARALECRKKGPLDGSRPLICGSKFSCLLASARLESS